MKNKIDSAEKFWKKWSDADILKRQKLLAPVVKCLRHVFEAEKMLKKKGIDTEVLIAQTLNGYFEDLENYQHSKLGRQQRMHVISHRKDLK